MKKYKKTTAPGKGKRFFQRLSDHTDTRTSTKTIRTLVDVGGALAGGFTGSLIGKNAALFGLGVLVTGNFVNDRTGIYKTVGTGMLVYGVAKIMDSNSTVQGLNGSETMKERASRYKDELLAAFYLDKLFKKSDPSTTAARTTDDGSVGAIDLSALDFFDEYNQDQATQFEYNRQSLPEGSVNGTEDEDYDSGYEYQAIDLPDLDRM